MNKLYLLLFLPAIISINLYSQEVDTINSTYDDPVETTYNLDYKLFLEAESGDVDKIIKLIGEGANVNARSDDGSTPLHFAVSNGHFLACKALIANGADVNIEPFYDDNALTYSAKVGNLKITELLLHKGALVDYKDEDGVPPLLHSVIYGYYTQTDMLLHFKADINITDNHSTNALQIASFYGDTAIAQLLINRDIKINHVDKYGLTALMMAAQNGYFETVQLLLNNNADADITNNKGLNAFDVAVRNGYQDIVELLINDTNINRKISNIYTPLQLAKISNQKEIATLLKTKGGKSGFKPLVTKSALSYGVSFNSDDIFFNTEFGFHDIKYNLDFNLGFANRYHAKKVFMQQSENLLYQYREKRSQLYINLHYRFNIYSYDLNNTGLILGVKPTINFGKYRGLSTKIDNQISIVPQAGLFYNNKNVALKVYYEYSDMDIYSIRPHRVNIMFSVYFLRIKFNHKDKEIYWP